MAISGNGENICPHVETGAIRPEGKGRDLALAIHILDCGMTSHYSCYMNPKLVPDYRALRR